MATQKRTILITGCSEGGLGEELAKQYHARGLRVFATARNPASMASLQLLGIETIVLDVTKADSITSVKARVEQLTGGKLNILINNAGTSYPYAAADISVDKVRELFEVNLFGVMAMVKEFVPLLVASEDGCIVNIGSLTGVAPVPFNSLYGSSKAALHSYSDTLRVELAPFKVKVLTILTGNVKTNITHLAHHKLPETSMYMPIQAEYKYRRLEHFADGAPERQPVVAQIVAESLRRNPRAWFWVGLNSWKIWFVSTFMGRRGFDKLVTKTFGLDKLARLVREGKTKTA